MASGKLAGVERGQDRGYRLGQPTDAVKSHNPVNHHRRLNPLPGIKTSRRQSFSVICVSPHDQPRAVRCWSMPWFSREYFSARQPTTVSQNGK